MIPHFMESSCSGYNFWPFNLQAAHFLKEGHNNEHWQPTCHRGFSSSHTSHPKCDILLQEGPTWLVYLWLLSKPINGGSDPLKAKRGIPIQERTTMFKHAIKSSLLVLGITQPKRANLHVAAAEGTMDTLLLVCVQHAQTHTNTHTHTPKNTHTNTNK